MYPERGWVILIYLLKSRPRTQGGTGKDVREPARSQAVAGGEAGSTTSRTPSLSAPRRTRSQVRPAPLPAWARPGVSSCRAAPPPPSLGACSHSPRGFTFGPGPCRLPAPGKLQPAREEGELGAGEAPLRDPHRVSGTGERAWGSGCSLSAPK